MKILFIAPKAFFCINPSNGDTAKCTQMYNFFIPKAHDSRLVYKRITCKISAFPPIVAGKKKLIGLIGAIEVVESRNLLRKYKMTYLAHHSKPINMKKSFITEQQGFLIE